MKISKRDRHLLIFLAVVLVLFAYYMWGLKPMEAKIKSIEDEISAAQVRQNEIRGILSTESDLDQKIKDQISQMRRLTFSYFVDLSEEEILVILSRLASPLELSFNQFAFSPLLSVTNDIESDSFDTGYAVNVNYSGDYTALSAFLRELRQYKKKICVSGLDINTEGELVSGKMTIDFNVLGTLKSYNNYSTPYLSAVENTRDITLSPFYPYSDFLKMQENKDELPENEIEPLKPDEEEIDYEHYKPKTLIYGFEDGAYFFVGNTSEIQGNITRSKTSKESGYSAYLTFDYYNAREYSEVSLVFETDIVLNRQPESIGVWLYAFEASNHNIGFEVVDNVGKKHKIELANGVDFTQWKELEAKMPLDISYPCKVKRIYVEGVGYGQKLLGKYLFDQLQVSYPVE